MVRAVAIAAFAAIAAGAAAETSGTLTIFARNVADEGAAAAGVFVAADSPEGLLKGLTDARGRAEWRVADPAAAGKSTFSFHAQAPSESHAAASLAGFADYGIVRDPAPRMRRSAPGNAMLSFDIFPKDTRPLAAEQRSAIAARWPEVLEGRRERGRPLPEPLDEPTGLRLSAFLEGYRTEADAPPVQGDAAIAAKLIDESGRPLAGRRAVLWVLDPAAATVSQADAERTDGEGLAVFSQVAAGRFYRVEAPAGEGTGTSARSAIVRPGAKETLSLRPLVARPDGRTISGLLLWNDRPIPGARISAAKPSLEAITDEFGYFELAPVAAEGASLSIRRLPGSKPVMHRSEPGREEVAIPLDVLSPEAPPAP